MSSQIEPSTPERERGTVKWFDPKKGFGFITRDAGEDVFVHSRNPNVKLSARKPRGIGQTLSEA